MGWKPAKPTLSKAGAPKHFSKTYIISKVRDFPGPVVKTALPLQGPGVRSVVRQLGPHAAIGIPRAAAEPPHAENKWILKNKWGRFTPIACVSEGASVVSDSLQPVHHTPPGSSVHGILPPRLEWVAISSRRGLADPGMESTPLHLLPWRWQRGLADPGMESTSLHLLPWRWLRGLADPGMESTPLHLPPWRWRVFFTSAAWGALTSATMTNTSMSEGAQAGLLPGWAA